MVITDTHCHLDFPELSEQLAETLTACTEQGVHRIIIPCISPKNWQSVLALSSLALAHESPNLYPALGIHPWFLNDAKQSDDSYSIKALDKLLTLNRSQIVAVGEAGIDGKIALEQDNMPDQIDVFEQQLQLAVTHDLPIIVHHRRSHPEVLACLKQYRVPRGGIIHAFSGSYQQATQYIDLGFKLGIGGTITYERAQKTIKAVKRLPLESLVLETDAPAMPLSGFQGEPNHPKRLSNVLAALSAIREETEAEIVYQTERNVDQVFFSG